MKRRAPLAAINLTPLIDVLLILVAILLLFAPQLARRLPVDVPRTSLAGTPVVQQSLRVTLDREGQLALDGERLPLKAIEQHIEKDVTTVEIAASGAVSYAQVTQLIESLSAARPREIVLLSR